MPNQKDDMIGKRVNDAGKIFGWIKDNPLAFLCTFLSILCAVFVYLFVTAKNENITLLQEQVKLELDRQLPKAIEDKVAPMKAGVERATNQIDTLIKNITK